MVSLITLKCPECGASLDVDPEREQVFCSYCGRKILIKDENMSVIKHITVDETEIQKAKMNKEIRILKMQLEAEERRKQATTQKNIILLGIGAVLLFFILLMASGMDSTNATLIIMIFAIIAMPAVKKGMDDEDDKSA